METEDVNLRSEITLLSQIDQKCNGAFQKFLDVEEWDKNQWDEVLSAVAAALLDPDLTLLVGANLRPWILELLSHATEVVKKLDAHPAFCVSLSKLVTVSNDVNRFVLKYFQSAPAPFHEQEGNSCEPKQKKLKNGHELQKHCVTDVDIAKATYILLQHVGEDLIYLWKWSDILPFLNHSSEEVRWLMCQCIAISSRMTEMQRESLIRKHVPEEVHISLSVENTLTSKPKLPEILGETREMSECQQFQHTVAVGLVALPVYSKEEQKEEGCLVKVPSTRRNLECLALAVSRGDPVLIEGVVGSGKTSLVEHLACVTGRSKAPLLIKVQLGDQTDSKTLLGTYCCTQTPGEFIWRPGSVTQAVTQGYWLLLEDLDYAPMDVISILVPLLETRTLPLPGHGNVRAHPDFQLFATRRTLGGAKMVSGNAGLLEKLWLKITLETLKHSELKEIVTTRWPVLETITDKLVGTYLMMSAGHHEDDRSYVSQDNIVDLTTVKVSGRLVSTRDLMKWCARVSEHMENTDCDLAQRAFQEALDVFCAAIPNKSAKFTFAMHIGSFMNRNRAESEYYCTKYMPEIKFTNTLISIGERVKLPKKCDDSLSLKEVKQYTFSFTRPALSLLERIGVSLLNEESVLIVGETGTGKTSAVQYLAHQTRQKLRVINMNQQSDSSDLLGGFKPVDLKTVVTPIRQEFEHLFTKTFSAMQNNTFLQHIMVCFMNKRWNDLFALMSHTNQKAVKKIKDEMKNKSNAKKIRQSKLMLSKWEDFGFRMQTVKEQVSQAQNVFAFSFIEGVLIKAIQEGEWVLLDEINLASAETLECLSSLLESKTGSLTLLERGDTQPIVRHSEFRLFACMNPATDVGKKELPPGLRNRFTEFFMEELETGQDLIIIIKDYLEKLGPNMKQIEGIVKFYKNVREANVKLLNDGMGHKPHFSLRTLCRALAVAARNPCSSVKRSLYEAFCLSFLTQLDNPSYAYMVMLIKKYILGVDSQTYNSLKGKIPLDPIAKPKNIETVKVEDFWVPVGDAEQQSPHNYIITKTVKKNLLDIVRVVSIGRFPVLLQGETSVGKTSLITYLARITGTTCVRINNHEHTDLQEYVGSYAPDESGKLVFKHGVLVNAMRNGHWIILDELNLAPTDVLEALNRLLDDNRELFIPETQETIKAHPHFMLFATQNPPGLYGGRKVLSRAFRNRFVELHFQEIPTQELEIILHQRCEIPLSYSKNMVAVLHELQNMRRSSNVFQGKQSFITLRDLFRWAERYRLAPKQTTKYYDWNQHLVDEGYLVLAGRVRVEEEVEAIQTVLEKRFGKAVDVESLFVLSEKTSPVTKECLEKLSTVKGFEHVVWTQDMSRLYVLAAKSLSFKEPVLLVGETGCGKTTVCQMIAAQKHQELFTINCHMHTEGADFLGGLRPVRSRTEEDDRLFEWVDGPLILSMRDGGMFLADEISLADDSVLERLNSVLEPERMLVLAEKGTDGVEYESNPDIIYAHEDFRLIGTMNPGGDYGKKELSPALRNRFTEIWCPKVEIGRPSSGVLEIIEHNVKEGIILNSEDNTTGFGKAMFQFLEHFIRTELGSKCVISIRDLLSWVTFINKVTESECLDPGLAYIHGACLVLLDGLGSGRTGTGLQGWRKLREGCLSYLCQQVWQKTGVQPNTVTLDGKLGMQLNFVNNDTHFGIEPFIIPKGPVKENKAMMFTFRAPRTCVNLLRLLRGLQLSKPLLLEGSPGVGKTSLVIALAKSSGNNIVRINLSEQTDVSDLFGADLPVEGGEGGRFAWRDGPLLQALREGSWVVLDELNLASQSVLEGLNACFDHRGEIFVPELGKVFKIEHQNTKIFACQNPQFQGGARKGLPKSFLNRFTQVHIEPLSAADLEFILGILYESLPKEIIAKMVKFNTELVQEISEQGLWGHCGGPWELNLRDMCRWCDIMLKHQSESSFNPGEYVGIIYSDRMRTAADKENVFTVYNRIFGEAYPSYQSVGRFHVTQKTVQVGHSFIDRKTGGDYSREDNSGELFVIHHQLPTVESLISCVNMNWMALMVGASGVGKTSVVKLLARLTGNQLYTFTVNSDMDVTELLGGFQQVDYGRSLGDIVEETENAVSAAVRQLVLASSSAHAKKILKSWELFTSVHNDKTTRTTSGEVEHFLHRCDLLLDLLQLLTEISENDKMQEKSPVKGRPKKRRKSEQKIQAMGDNVKGLEELVNISKMMSDVKKLQNQVKEAGIISGGGTFQWVDSILVKAVREGYWLLVEGVNVCSPSVLDRLNALLEPGGVLTISERGVVDGAVPFVTPHKDFRLFLAMDPQNGEISRAMRNRGIEICSVNTWTKPQDFRALLLQNGITSSKLQNTLYESYRLLTTELPVHERPSICQFKQTASMMNQLVQRGFGGELAVRKALSVVYIRSQGKAQLQDEINHILHVIPDFLEKSMNLPWPLYEHQTLSTCRLSGGSSLAHAKVLSSLLHSIILAQIYPESAEACGSETLPATCPLPVMPNSVKNCLALILSLTPLDNWQMIHKLLVKLISKLPQKAKPLGELVVSVLQSIVSQKVCKASETLQACLGNFLAVDPRFNVHSLEVQGCNKSEVDVEGLANKSKVWIWKSVNHYFEEDPQDKKEDEKKKMDAMTLLEISESISKGRAGKHLIHHPSIPLLYPFLKGIDQLISALTDNTQVPLTDLEWCHLASSLHWQDRLTKLCSKVIEKSRFHLFLPQLTLHWEWIDQYLLKKIPETWNEIASAKLKNIVSQMQTIFEKEFGALHKLAAEFRSHMAPAPFISPFVTDAQAKLMNLIDSVAPAADKQKVNLFLASKLGIETRESLMQRAVEVGNCSSEIADYVDVRIDTLESVINSKCLQNERLLTSKDVDLTVLTIQTWPLQDFLALIGLSLGRISNKIPKHISDMLCVAPGVFKEMAAVLSCPGVQSGTAVDTHYYLTMRQSTAFNKTRSFLEYTLHSSEDDHENEKDRHAHLYHPSACQLTYILSTGNNSPGSGNENIIEEVAVGLHIEKVSQLQSTRSTLWSNWTCLTDPDSSYEASFTRAALAYIASTLNTLAFICHVDMPSNVGVSDLQTASSLAVKLADSSLSFIPEECKELLLEIADSVVELEKCSSDWQTKSALAAHAVLAVGMFRTSLLAYMEPVDSAQRVCFLLRYYEEEMEDLQSNIRLADWCECLQGGLGNAPLRLSHPHGILMKERHEYLKDESHKLNQKVAYRPDPPTYPQLKQDIHHFLSTVFYLEKFKQLLVGLKCKESSIQDKTILMVDVMLSSCDNFVKQMVRQYPLYRDITYPLLQSVTMSCEALRLLVTHARIQRVSASCGTNVTESLAQYSSFPVSREPLDPLKQLSKQLEVKQTVPVLLPEDEYPGQAKLLSTLVLRSVLLDLFSTTLAQAYLDKKAVQMIMHLLEQVTTIWRQQEEEKALKAQEKESLYRYKDRTMAESETEDETIEREFSEAFPSFDDEFDDLDGINLNDSKKAKKRTNKEKDEDEVFGQLSDKEVQEISELHRLLFTNLVNTSWCSAPSTPSVSPSSQMIPASIIRLRVLRTIINTIGPIAGSHLDRVTLGAHILSNHNSCAILTHDPPAPLVSHPYNIYLDPNPQEALKVRPLVQAVRERVDELLRSWPDHPVLMMVNTVVNRVLGFTLTSPLMRHIVGLETILEKAQEWEKNAHASVSMMEQLEAVTHQIIEWRKLELHGWKNCLNMITHKVATEGRKWWPHLYEAFQVALAEKVSLDEVSKTLKQFFETSLLGDFQLRLEMLYAFHCNLAVLEKSKLVEKLLALTWNLHQYYLQYLPEVTATLSKARKPIDKEVKGFVKIAQWRDINFFSVRESVNKSHRTLHRHMRSWEKKLRQPASPLFHDADSELSQNQTGAWDKEPDNSLDLQVAPTVPSKPSEVDDIADVPENTVLGKLGALTPRCHKLVTSTLKTLPYASHIEMVEEMTAAVISNYQELQAAGTKAEGISESENRLKSLRSVMQRRRDSLAQLFKALTATGVTYTRGNSMWSDGDVEKCLHLPPLNLEVAHSGSKSLKSAREAWSGCQKYLDRCIGRQTRLLTALQQPHGDLGPELIKRLRGVSCYLFILARDQRKALASISGNSRRLSNILQDVATVTTECHPVVSLKIGWQTLHGLATSLALTTMEVCALLDTVPTSPPLLLLQENSAVPDEKDLEEAKIILGDIEKLATYFARKLAKQMELFDEDRMLTVEHTKVFRETMKEFIIVGDKIQNITVLLSSSKDTHLPVTDHLNVWLRSWKSVEADLTSLMDSESQVQALSDDSIRHVEYCLTQVLLGVEHIYKLHKKQQEDHDDDETPKKDLTEGLVENLENDSKALRLGKVVKILEDLVKKSENHPQILLVLKSSLPLIEQYQALCQSVLTYMAHSNRSISKFASVIMAIFHQLALKGFCRPKELEEEAGEEGATKFEDSEGTGLGDGEGQKDMSDRLESEDQLESALQEGESEKEGDKDLKEDEGVEMSEDFEGKMQDVEKGDDDDDNESEDDDDKDMEEQMGETEKGSEKLDEKVWDDNGESDEEDEEKKEEDDGTGEEIDGESKMVAKDEKKSNKGRDQDQKKKEKLKEMEDKLRENEDKGEGEEEYDDNFKDEFGGEEGMENEDEDPPMQLPEDMNLGDDKGEGSDASEGEGEGENDGEGEENMEENPFEFDEMGILPEEALEPKKKGEEEKKEKEREGEEEDQTKDEAAEEEAKEEEKDKADDKNNEKNKGEKPQGTEEEMEKKEDEDKTKNEEKADASNDQDSKTNAEAAEMNTTQASKDMTKQKPKEDAGAQPELDEDEKQEEHGQTGEQTEDQEGVGESESRTREEAHEGDNSALVTEDAANDNTDMEKPRRPGETDDDRTLGDEENKAQQGLMSVNPRRRNDQRQNQEEQEEKKSSKEYEHINKAQSHFDKQVVDAGTQEQAQEAPAPANTEEDEDNKMDNEEMMDTPMEVDEDLGEAEDEKEALGQDKERNEGKDRGQSQPDPQGEDAKVETEGEIILAATVERAPESFIHTLLTDENEYEEGEDAYTFNENEEETRQDIETATAVQTEDSDAAWMKHEARVANMALQLCEQLRLILEPTQAARLRGDYRTGKRLNMRKVIPYIASQFRKDKIWLRRTQPSKRTYQIILAVDDSESMAETRTSTLATESVALVTKALTLLESGEVGVLSFGASTNVLHPLGDTFSDESGSRILANLTFEQKMTNFGKLLEDAVAMFKGVKRYSSHGNPDTAQLLIILSDGQTHTRAEQVKAAVRRARLERVFIVFIVLDAKDSQYSFYDILVYEEGEMRPLVETFPFPFFLVVRDLETLPQALSTALRQWFELVTADAKH
ncbi:LOW QUALITY PROTEIN: midasin-like [Penaeus chinensis]|uniref:LOW QUALITY PROTEIN: midasin-like n=1 Tax=Penaeus chinensis TaxID=139456 RepID=UPI001FB6FCB3|nr:LOW QUALITY PROTEIN: midasin-like [Penaeus chinensis]